jgi:CspA family cold shock protein
LGTVQWFSRVKGYGFIRPDGEEEDVFIHYSLIRGEGYRNLSRGQRVEFTMEDTPKGPQAVDVVGLDMDSEADTGVGEVGFEEDPEMDTGVGVVGFEEDPEMDTGVGVVGFEQDTQYGLGEAEF